ncbi:hypothetical protein QFZ41_003480 [Luteibacter sp. W1I16]
MYASRLPTFGWEAAWAAIRSKVGSALARDRPDRNLANPP